MAHPTSSALLNHLNNWSDKCVLVIGDIMLDKFIYGSVSRISPESPVPVLAVSRERQMLGGAGNTLNNLVNLGIQTKIMTLTGDDENAGRIAQFLDDMGVNERYVAISNDRPTTVKMRYLAGHQQLLRTDYEHAASICKDIEKELTSHLDALIKGVDCIILSDYGKGMLTPPLIQNIIKAAKKHKIPAIVDPKGADYSIYKGATALTPNKQELSLASGGMDVDSDENIITAAKNVLKHSGVKAIIATRSAEGISVIHNGKVPTTHIPGADIEVYDVSGAGDTVIATIASVMATGGSLEEAASLANIAGRIVVTKVGTAPIRKDELKDALENEALDAAGGTNTFTKNRDYIFSNWDEAAEVSARWKAQGLKVGFTNGCFDILHAGHTGYLTEAKSKCDRLVMGLNSDSSVRILKGAERPVHDEQSRAEVLAALSSIDMVILFGAKQDGDDNTACKLIETIQPDIYFKGGDYAPEDIPETPSVRAHGGEVCVMSVFAGHSTTNSITKIKTGKKGTDKAA